MAEIVLDRVRKEFANGFVAVDDVSLDDRTTASSWCSSAPPAAARPRCCG